MVDPSRVPAPRSVRWVLFYSDLPLGVVSQTVSRSCSGPFHIGSMMSDRSMQPSHLGECDPDSHEYLCSTRIGSPDESVTHSVLNSQRCPHLQLMRLVTVLGCGWSSTQHEFISCPSFLLWGRAFADQPNFDKRLVGPSGAEASQFTVIGAGFSGFRRGWRWLRDYSSIPNSCLKRRPNS